MTPVPSLKPLGLPAAERCFGPRALAPGEHVWKSDTLPLGAPRPVLCDRLGDDKRLRGAQRGGRGGWEAVPRWGLSRGARGSPQRALTRALARGPRGPIRPGTLRSSPGGPVEKDCRPESAASGRESEGRLGTSTPQEPVAEEEPGHRQPTGAQPDPNEPRGSPSLLFTLLPFDGVQSRRKQGSCWGQNHAALRGPRPQGVLTPPPPAPTPRMKNNSRKALPGPWGGGAWVTGAPGLGQASPEGAEGCPAGASGEGLGVASAIRSACGGPRGPQQGSHSTTAAPSAQPCCGSGVPGQFLEGGALKSWQDPLVGLPSRSSRAPSLPTSPLSWACLPLTAC